MAVADRTDDELAKLYIDTGIDLTTLPAVMTAEVLAPVVFSTVGALAQDRYRGGGIPYIKMGRRVRYLRTDVCRYLLANRYSDGALTTAKKDA
jgi:hypothetical protein